MLIPATLRSTDASGIAAAEAAFAHLAAGRRRDGSRALRQTLALEPAHASAQLWRRQLSSLEQRWHGAAYIVLRDDGDLLAAASPVLGAGQSGLQLDYLPDPLALRPLALTGRLITPNRGAFGVAREWQAVLGLSWRPTPSALLTAERLIGLGSRATDAWTRRAAAGAATTPAGDRWLDLSIYGEAGIIGVNRRATFAVTQGRVGIGLRFSPRLAAHAGLGGWASLREDASRIGHLALGPTLGPRVKTRPAILLAVDYRIRVAGDARPASGPALTLSTQF